MAKIVSPISNIFLFLWVEDKVRVRYLIGGHEADGENHGDDILSVVLGVTPTTHKTWITKFSLFFP